MVLDLSKIDKNRIISVDALDISFSTVGIDTQIQERKEKKLVSSLKRVARFGRDKPTIPMGYPEEAAEPEKKPMATEACRKKAITIIGMLTVALLLSALIMGCNMSGKNRHRLHRHDYKNKFKEDAENILAGIRTNIYSTLEATDAFATSMVYQAKASNQAYPFVKIDDFDDQSGKLLNTSRAKYITTYQMVGSDQLADWEDFAANHSSEISQILRPHNYDNNGTSIGWDLPSWQHTPKIPIEQKEELELLSKIVDKRPTLSLMENPLVTISEPYMIDQHEDTRNEEEEDVDQLNGDSMAPFFEIYYPVITNALNNFRHHKSGHTDSAQTSSDDNTADNQVGAYLGLSINWQDILRDLLPIRSAAVVVVLKTECDVTPFAFEITGNGTKYLGDNFDNLTTTLDHHEMIIDEELFDNRNFGIGKTSYTGIHVNKNGCPYNISFFPSQCIDQSYRQRRYHYGHKIDWVLRGIFMPILVAVLLFFLYSRLSNKEVQTQIDLLEAKRDFVRFVSHEVRTPLNSVCMGVSLIQQEFKKYEKQLRKKKDPVTPEDIVRWYCMAQDVSNNIDVAVGVLNDLLNIDKIKMGSFKFEMEALPTWDLIEQTTSEFKMMAARQNTELKLDLSSLTKSSNIESGIVDASMLPESIQIQKVVGDDQRLRQVIRNLVSNAIKFSKNESVTVKVSRRDRNSIIGKTYADQATKKFDMVDGTRKTFVTSGRIIVEVMDTGVGMTQFELETVFDVGTQFKAKKLQSGGGSGLGLAFAKAIVEQHGGSLQAYSDGRDKGTTLRLDLPLYLENSDGNCCDLSTTSSIFSDDASDQSFKTAPKKSFKSTRRRRRRVQQRRFSNPDSKNLELVPMHMAIVDDDPIARKLLVRLLESYGHTCDQLNNGQELIDKIKDNPIAYDCILLDYEMPVMSGPEASAIIREMENDVLMLGVTGNLLPEDIGHFMDCGVDSVLPKPMKYEELMELLVEFGVGIAAEPNSGHFDDLSKGKCDRRGSMVRNNGKRRRRGSVDTL